MKAREIMTTNPDVVTVQDTVTRAAEIMRDTDVGIVPVVEDVGSRKLSGVITDRDIAIRHVAGGHAKDCPVQTHMSRNVTTVSPDDDVEQVMSTMRREQIRRIPVVESGDRLVGIIAQADIATEHDNPADVGRTVEAVSQPNR